MITEQDLQAAIAECQGERDPNANTCIKLAAYYTIMREMFGNTDRLQRAENAYSYAAPPDQKQVELITIESDTEFARVIDGREQKDVWPVLDELMETLHDMQPRLYRMVMERLR